MRDPVESLLLGPMGVLSSYGECSVLADPFSVAAGSLASAGVAYQSASQASYQPVLVNNGVTVNTAMWTNGATVSGNCDIGLYDRNFNKLWSAGSTAQSGASVSQIVTISTPIYLDPDLYYMAFACDNTTATIGLSTGTLSPATALFTYACGCMQQASAFPLPSPATPVKPINGYYPAIAFGMVPSVL